MAKCSCKTKQSELYACLTRSQEQPALARVDNIVSPKTLFWRDELEINIFFLHIDQEGKNGIPSSQMPVIKVYFSF